MTTTRLPEAAAHPVRRRSHRMKRLFDVTVAASALLLVSPLLLAIAVAVKLDSQGPVLFQQLRVGRGGTLFRIKKFRTMIDGAERLAPHISPTTDPRVTRVGRLLRHWYLDELPQLVNVLTGDMSLVGPRPETPEFVAQYLPAERHVLRVRPGLVGPSTLAFMDEEARLAEADDPLTLYTDDIMRRRVQADLTYLDRASFWFDIRLLLQQLWAILRRI